MTRVIATVLLLCASVAGQAANEAPQRTKIFENNRVTVSRITIPPGVQVPLHKHDLDMVEVFIDGGVIESTQAGQEPTKYKLDLGEVRFRNGGFSHTTKNIGTTPLTIVAVEFLSGQGKMTKVRKKSETCAPDKKACVEEKELFCTEKVCVEDVSMAPGSVSVKHSHTTDHMLVAVSNYELSDEVEGKGTVVRNHQSGEVEYIPAGITHRLTNAGKDPARFAVILWK